MSAYQESAEDGLTAEELAALSLPDDASEKQQFDPNAEVDHVNEEETAPAQAAAPASEPAADPDAATGADDAQPSTAADPAPQAQADPSPAVEAPKVATAAPILVVAAPEDAQEKIADFAKQKAALVTEFEDGDITAAQFHTKVDEINERLHEVKRQIDRAELAQQLEGQRIQNMWADDCKSFLAKHAEYNSDPERMKLLDETIRALATMPSNQGLSNEKALSKAHNIVKLEMGEPVDVPAVAAPKTVVQHKVPRPDAPPNIGSLPTAALNDTTGGEFASIETLRKSGDVEAYERALEGLSEAQATRYFRA